MKIQLTDKKEFVAYKKALRKINCEESDATTIKDKKREILKKLTKKEKRIMGLC